MRFWKLFGKRRTLDAGFAKGSGGIGSRSDAWAERLAVAIVVRQRRLAAYLERRTQHWNKASKLIALYLFCLLFGGFSLWLLIRAFM